MTGRNERDYGKLLNMSNNTTAKISKLNWKFPKLNWKTY